MLAAAGLHRLGREGAITRPFTLHEMVPAPGQGALAVEARPGSPAEDLVAAIDDEPVRAAVSIERRLLEETGAGCRSALGAFATVEGNSATLYAFVADERGPRHAIVTGAAAEDVVGLARKELEL